MADDEAPKPEPSPYAAKGVRGWLPGNPGKKKGTRHRSTMMLEELLYKKGDELTEKCLQMAASGDFAALKFALERVIPLRRGRTVALKLSKVTDAAGVRDALAKVTENVAAAEMTPDEGALMAQILMSQLRAIETVDLEARMKAIECRMELENGFES